MRTVRTKVYQFSELSKDAQQKAISWFLNLNQDSSAFDDTKEDAEQIGMEIICFRDRHPNEGKFMLAANEVAQNIFNNHGEHCETYKTAQSFMDEWQPVFNNYMATEEGEDKLMDIEDEFLNSLLEDYRMMYDRHLEYEYSDEYAKEMIEANEYEFTKEGRRF